MQKNNYKTGKIVCLETGIVYESASELARILGCSKSAISNHLAGRFPHIRGKHFCYV